MTSEIKKIIEKPELSRDEIIMLLSVDSEAESQLIFEKAFAIKNHIHGSKIYLRGLIELTNKCLKNCYYCGIRSGNKNATRYELSEKEALQAAVLAWEQGFGSIVIQSGELKSEVFASKIERLLQQIHHKTNNELSVTLSCGEQTLDTYKRWVVAGAHRYLLRIESSNETLYYKIHPNDQMHDFQTRLQALHDLRTAGFLVGTGVMIGLPEQTIAHLADDLLFFKNFGVDMVGMGPYLEHHETPLFEKNHLLWSESTRFQKSLLMIAILRIMMPHINIAASTALETLNPLGRQKGILAGANVIMPNVTPLEKKINYDLYDKKPHLYNDTEKIVQAAKQIRDTNFLNGG
ncbi:MAG: [FeFe] hydrogenase H-cluster radical SAM maturase HydE [Lentimicrobiaceae bacterium]|jgi:biotin synthase|nr:[FeFe] hydrogenase H-cluster radical SAM maturase HydE [Lentimicrobiaceae bacterium]